MSDERQKINREIYEYSGVEGEAERLAQFTEPGSWIHRVLMWIARQCAKERAELREERNNLP